MISHDMTSLREMCTRGIWMNKGQVVADGPMSEIIDAYLAATATLAAAG